MSFQSFHGAWPALITPATAEGEVNVPVLRDLTAHLLNKGIGGLYVCGTTGEGMFMSVAERQLVAETVIDEVNGRTPVIVHVGSIATRDAVILARHARDVGADGVASILPLFGAGLASTYLHYETIAAAVPELPFYPYLFGGQTDAVSLLRELRRRIPTLAGAKYTGPNMYELQALVAMQDANWTIFSGMDEQCAFAAMFGATANIGSTLNVMPGVYREIRAACERGDLARARDVQAQANRVIRVWFEFGFPGAFRETLRWLGFDCGEPRLPNLPLPPEQREALHAALEAAEFWELTKM
ncbi:MAG TPA: dihydrodipicolinate synthase family protein [Anaerolineae bacterium]|nr:dihydrodipicolinate synthase family protein [Anaerolineae bacterium]HQI85345.1 dihydrodipicolinate synthase family protein [Anaerolineae bacterium]